MIDEVKADIAMGKKPIKDCPWILNVRQEILVRFCLLKAERSNRPFKLVCDNLADAMGENSKSVWLAIQTLLANKVIQCVRKGWSGKKGHASLYRCV